MTQLLLIINNVTSLFVFSP